MINDLIKRATKLAVENSPSILTAIGVTGTITTAYLTGKASYESAFRILEESHDQMQQGIPKKLSKREIAELVWPLFIPAAITGATTVACIVGANRVGARRAAALTAAYSLSEKAYSEYRDKVVETLGEKKEKAVRDEIAQEKVTRNPPEHVWISGSGNVLCCELLTGRYFHSEMEVLKKAVNEMNAQLLRHDYVTLGELYYAIGLPQTSMSSDIGWTSDRLLELEITTTLSLDDKPCIAFDYNYTKPL